MIDLLLHLASRPGVLVSRDELLQVLWGNVVVSEDALNAAISKLRRALGDPDRTLVETIPKRGYRLTMAPVAVPDPPDFEKARRRVWVVPVVLALVALGGAIILSNRTPSPAPVAPPLGSPQPVTSLPGLEGAGAGSPVDDRVTFCRTEGATSQIYITQEGQSPRLLSEGQTFDYSPVWSPDGSRIAFLRRDEGRNSVCMVEVASEVLEVVLEGNERLGDGLDWSEDGSRLLFSRSRDGAPAAIKMYDLILKTLTTLSTPEASQWGDQYPRFSPQGHRVAFVRTVGFRTSEIHVVSLDDETSYRLVGVAGMMDGIAWRNEDQIIFASNHSGTSSLFMADSFRGDYKPFGAPGIQGRYPSISPRDDRLIYTNYRTRSDIWRIEIGADPDEWRNQAPLISSSSWDSTPQSSPDGRQIVWSSNRSGAIELWIAKQDGSGTHKISSLPSAFSSAPRWSPDGKSIAFDTKLDGRSQVYVLRLEDGSVRSAGHPDANNMLPTWSRDGQSLFLNQQLGANRRLVRWSLDGREVETIGNNRSLLATESQDGTVHFVDTNDGGAIMRRAPNGSVSVAREIDAARWGNWEVVGSSIYYMTTLADGFSGIVRWNSESEEEVLLARCDNELENLALDVSADEGWLLVARVIEDESDVMELVLP